ncbi:MAG: DUF5682 family protein [Acidobacteria bacterium]|nr:DUF5682 family protein [Acidobacteriota bacterium]
MSIQIFGIRHHGPGSARSLRDALESLQPDLILVEGPPDAADVLSLLRHPAMQPPVALLIHVFDDPKRSVFYPFAIFSPEWQALQYALTHNVTARFMDLPQAHQLAFEPQISDIKSGRYQDPLRRLAEAAGYTDGEQWWEMMVEERSDGYDLFAAIFEAMSALRESFPVIDNPIEAQREAFMRQTIRVASREGFQRIAVVCGAWHAPALDINSKSTPSAKNDAAQLKGLLKTKVRATWVPWTNGRLSLQSGYGAGITSPGWYQHLWAARDNVAIRWMVQVAQLLRGEDLDVSPANVIEAIRLAETLTALRGRSSPGLTELNEATQTVLCFGSNLPLRLIHDKLIVGETLGQVPAETPMPPIQQDLHREQKRLRLPAEAGERTLDLDLRRATDLDRSRLLHRLTLLRVPWGESQRVTGKGSTFHEIWRLRWQPEFVVAVIEASIWGKTILEAATAYVRDVAGGADDLPGLTNLLDRALLADLPDAIGRLMERLQSVAALTSDATQMMGALPPLANIMRYGNVRKTDATMVGEILDGLVARICIGLPGACASLNDEAAAIIFEHIIRTNSAINLLRNDDYSKQWHNALLQMVDQRNLHGLVAGRCCRLLLDSTRLAAEEAALHLRLALSTANEPGQAATWVEGFLKGSGLLLLHDETLSRVLDDWVTRIHRESFTMILPLLRRTFATFTTSERRQIGERVKSGMKVAAGPTFSLQSARADFDQARAEAVLPLVAKLLGVEID